MLNNTILWLMTKTNLELLSNTTLKFLTYTTQTLLTNTILTLLDSVLNKDWVRKPILYWYRKIAVIDTRLDSSIPDLDKCVNLRKSILWYRVTGKSARLFTVTIDLHTHRVSTSGTALSAYVRCSIYYGPSGCLRIAPFQVGFVLLFVVRKYFLFVGYFTGGKGL